MQIAAAHRDGTNHHGSVEARVRSPDYAAPLEGARQEAHPSYDLRR